MGRRARGGSPLGLHRVVEPLGALPQAAWRLNPSPGLWPDEVRVDLDRLNLDAASMRQLHAQHGGDGRAVRSAVVEIVRQRGKMHNPVTGSGGMLIGRVAECGPRSPLGLQPGDRIATLVSLTLTPLRLTDDLRRWGGLGAQVPAAGHAILFGRSVATVLPDDLPDELALAVLDVCGAAALTSRVVRPRVSRGSRPLVVVLGAAGKSGALALVAARRAGAGRTVGVVRDETEAALLRSTGLADEVAVADACEAVGLAETVRAAGGPAEVTIVCVDAAGAEHGALLATRDGGTVVFFSMATSFSAAALGAEGLAADVEMIIGNGYAPGHAAAALDLVRDERGLRTILAARAAQESAGLTPIPGHRSGTRPAGDCLPGGQVSA